MIRDRIQLGNEKDRIMFFMKQVINFIIAFFDNFISFMSMTKSNGRFVRVFFEYNLLINDYFGYIIFFSVRNLFHIGKTEERWP